MSLVVPFHRIDSISVQLMVGIKDGQFLNHYEGTLLDDRKWLTGVQRLNINDSLIKRVRR